MTMAETAEYLGISITTFKEHYLSWKVPHYRLGPRVLFRRDDLEEWLKTVRPEGARKPREAGARGLPARPGGLSGRPW